MATRKPRTKKVKEVIEDTNVQHGLVEGEYSKALWNNGELISFDIDWDKLATIVKKMESGQDGNAAVC